MAFKNCWVKINVKKIVGSYSVAIDRKGSWIFWKITCSIVSNCQISRDKSKESFMRLLHRNVQSI